MLDEPYRDLIKPMDRKETWDANKTTKIANNFLKMRRRIKMSGN